MSKTLTEIAELLQASDKKVQLIYAFNGTGKTRLSREFKENIAPKEDRLDDIDNTEQAPLSRHKILYYNAFTEDLFYWDNDLESDRETKLRIQPNTFTDWILRERGDTDIVKNFQRYTNDKLMPLFHEKDVIIAGKKTGEKTYPEVSFSFERGDDDNSPPVKISKGEESNFIWSIFYTLINQVIDVLAIPELDNRETDQFNQLEYIYIDDPVSSLDENHLIELAVDLAQLIKRTPEHTVKFIVSTHNPLFFNVLYNELNANSCYLLEKLEDGNFELKDKKGGANSSFSYHLYLKQLIEQAIKDNEVQRFHFNLLRNLYEKAASFLGYQSWTDLLPEDKTLYAKRVMHFYSHRSLSNEEVAEPTGPEKQIVKFLLEHLLNNYGFKLQGKANAKP